MKKYSYIFTLLIAVLVCSCSNKDLYAPNGEGGEDVILPNPDARYIYLDSGVKSRGNLVTGEKLQETFGAYGYKYDFSNKWTTYRVTAKPNVFGEDGIDANEKTYLATPVAPQEVTYADEIYSYTPIKQWDGAKYTFFAYYPFGHANVAASDENVEGTPYVTYSVDMGDSSNHADIMTAMFEDTSLSSSQYVYFNFYHRLAAIDVGALNFYQNNYDLGADATLPELVEGIAITEIKDENGTLTGYLVTENIQIEITSLNVAFTGIKYKGADIYLDKDFETLNSDGSLALPKGVKSLTNADSQPAYSIVKSPKTLNYNTDAAMQSISADNETTILFIPQVAGDSEAAPTVTTTVTFKKKRPDGTYLTYTNNNETYTETKEATFNREIKEGSRYYVQLTFTSSAVSINIITSDEWNDIKVGYEFE